MQIKIELVVLFISVFIMILSGIIGWVARVVVKCTEAIEAINVTLAKISVSNMYEDKECVLKHTYVSEKLKQHTEKLDNHEKRITKIEDK